METETLSERVAMVQKHIERAYAAAAEDIGASPVLVAVLGELQRKSVKAAALLDSALARETVVELEQAADSARVASKADRGAADSTHEAVERAHEALCMLKGEQGR